MSLIQTAQDYLTEGFNPLPLKATKAPMLGVGHPYLYELVAEKDIQQLFSPAEKIGIACGDVSDGFECMDFDAKKGQPIRDIFNKFMADPKVKDIVERNNLPVLKTPSGGYHIYYRHPLKGCPSMRLATWSTGEVMIETRGNGSYVATVPSEGYRELAGSDIIEVARIDKDERDVLIATAESLTQQTITKKENLTKGKWPTRFDTSTVWGKYNEECADEMKQILIDNGWEYIHTRKHDGVEYWQRPGKNERMPVTGATFGKLHNMFYCFTDSVPPFEQRTSYTPFDIFIIYKHGGNKKEAILELEERFGIHHYKKEAPPMPEPEPTITEFPIEVFPLSVQTYITELNSKVNFSKDFLSIAIMSAVSTLNGNKIKLQVSDVWFAPTIFWFAAVGEPGTMKSHPINTVLEPLHLIDKESKKIYDHEYQQYEQDVAEAKKKQLVKKPRFKQIKITDITLESLHDIHSINKRGLCYHRDELYGFLGDMNKYRQGSDEQFWLESFNNKSHTVNRISRPAVMIENININIIGTIQPSILSRVASKHSDNGLTDRFLYTFSDNNYHVTSNKKIDPEILQWWVERVKFMHNDFEYLDENDTVIIPLPDELDADFKALEKKICDMQQSDNVTDSVKNYLGKMKTYLPRFILLLTIMHASLGGKQYVVTKEIIHDTWKIIKYFLDSSETIFNRAERVNEINEVASYQKGKTKGEMILLLHGKGFKNADIAKKLGVSKAYVGQFLKSRVK